MATVTAQMVKELREATSAGMMDCKKALTEADGNMERASEILREKGLAAASKKAGRIAAEGIVSAFITDDSKIGVIVEVNSETDFVAKNEEFKNYVNRILNHIVDSKAADADELLKEAWIDDQTLTVEEALSQKIAIIGENLKIRRFAKFVKQDNGVLFSYIHAGGRVGVLLELSADNISPSIHEAGKNICMQIAAMSPQFLNTSDVSQEHIAKEKEIFTQQALNENPDKPSSIIDKMVLGRINKELKNICLNEQIYVKDDSGKQTIKEYVKSVSPDLQIVRFVRFETGEGIEKKEDNFADEVNKAMGN